MIIVFASQNGIHPIHPSFDIIILNFRFNIEIRAAAIAKMVLETAAENYDSTQPK